MRETVKLHTIQEWEKVDRDTRALICRGVRVKARLEDFMKASSGRKRLPVTETAWVPCRRCETRGFVEERPRRPGIHPSGVSTDCLRRLWYSATGAEESRVIDAELQVTFDIGHAVHRILQSFGERGAWGPDYVPEVDISGPPVADSLMIEGHADADTVATVDLGPNYPLFEVGIVHEYKTIKAEQYGRLTGPKPEHKQQATVYSAALDRPLVAYLYVNKNDSSMRDFVVQFDQSLWGAIAAKCKAVVEHVRNGTEPRGSPGFGCTQCSYAHACPDRGK